VAKLDTTPPIFAPLSRHTDLDAGPMVYGTETIDSVGQRVFEHVLAVASGAVPARAEETKHREFQFWAEQSVSL
jgi:altronate dehydratase